MSKDLFSDQAEDYALYRPTYPEELFTYILHLLLKKMLPGIAPQATANLQCPSRNILKKFLHPTSVKNSWNKLPKKKI